MAWGRKSLGDNDPMPFGKYKGVDMVCLPPTYVRWLLDQEWIGDWPAVATYLREHREEFARAEWIERIWWKEGWIQKIYG